MPRKAKPPNQGVGEWTLEPDKVEFEYRGVDCLILRHDQGKHLCGYFAIPKFHELYQVEYTRIGIRVHCGLTYGRSGSEYVGHPDDGRWWLGFDCAHAEDLSPGFAEMAPSVYSSSCIYRNVEYVKKQIMRAVDQVIRREYEICDDE